MLYLTGLQQSDCRPFALVDGFVAFNYQALSLQSFQAGAAPPEDPVSSILFIPSVNAPINSSGSRKGDVPAQSSQGAGDGDFNMRSPVSHVSSIEEDPTASESEASISYTGSRDVYMDNWPMSPRRREGTLTLTCFHSTNTCCESE